MKLAVSNICWTAEADQTIAPRLRDAGCDAIEVAPGRLFDNVSAADTNRAANMRAKWSARGLPMISMQALLYGQTGLGLFGGQANQMVAYLDHVIEIAGALGCGPLVFGSPGNRQSGEMSFADALAASVPVLRQIGDSAARNGCVFCLEANATEYGCDFMTRLSEAAAVTRAIDHEAVRMVVDTGNMMMESEPAQAVGPIADLVSHLHFSAPKLSPVLPHLDFMADTLAVLHDAGYRGDMTIEMRPIDAPDGVDQLLRIVEATRARLDKDAAA